MRCLDPVCLKFSFLDLESVGVGWCSPYGCHQFNQSCRINGYYKDGSTYQECKTTCLNESTCIGFAISEQTYIAAPNRCYVYGNISFEDGQIGWIAYPKNYFDIQTSTTSVGVHCYRTKGNYFVKNDNYIPGAKLYKILKS